MAKILIVDDEPRIRELIHEHLQYSGYICEEAGDGSAALAQLSGGGFDLVILDLMMPFMDGMTCLREMRARHINTPVIILTARGEEYDKLAGLESGADDYVVKPFDPRELLARIRTAIRHTRTGLDNDSIAQSGKYTVRDLTIDYDKHHVLMRGEDVHLTLNEFKIVALLGKYAGKVLTYDFLIREIWGPKAKADNQILRVNMANIRRKIEKNPAAPEYIFTEIGVGYRMLENE